MSKPEQKTKAKNTETPEKTEDAKEESDGVPPDANQEKSKGLSWLRRQN